MAGVEAGLQSIQDDFTHLSSSVFRVLKATLEYPASTDVKASKLADDVTFFTKAEGGGNCLGVVWWVIIDIARIIPPDHPWQDCLLQCLVSLRDRDEVIWPDKELARTFKDLPGLGLTCRERHDAHDPDFLEVERESENLERWSNLHSFYARLVSDGVIHTRQYAVWQLVRTLEDEEQMTGARMEWNLRAASEWLIRCTREIFELMNFKEELPESERAVFSTGARCEGVALLSMERWGFWTKRLSAIAADPGSLDLGEAVVELIVEVLRRMDAVDDVAQREEIKEPETEDSAARDVSIRDAGHGEFEAADREVLDVEIEDGRKEVAS